MIQLKNVSKVYIHKKNVEQGVNDINLILPNTGFVWLKGKSGAGKSTLLKLISLQFSPTGGEIFLEDKEISRLRSKEILGYRREYYGIVTQEFDLLNDFSVEKNLSLSREVGGLSIQKKELEAALEQVGLPLTYLSKKPVELSGGEKQRVALARALLRKPRALICDEPTGNLDEENASIVYDILKKISKDTLVVIASHDESVAGIADRTIFMKKGRIESDSDDLKQSDSQPFVLNQGKRAIPTYEPLLAFSFLKKGIKRFIFTMVTLVFSFSLALIGTAIRSFDKANAVNSVFNEHNLNYFSIRNHWTEKISPKVNHIVEAGFPLKDYHKAASIFGEDGVIPSLILNRDTYFRYESQLSPGEPGYIKGASIGPRILFFNIRRFSPLKKSNVSAFDFSLYGKMPEDGANNEILFTAYSCRQLKLLKWDEELNAEKAEYLLSLLKNKIRGQVELFVRYDENKNREKILDYKQTNVVGIIDTHENRAKQRDSETPHTLRLLDEDSEIHKTVFCSSSLLADLTPYARYCSDNKDTTGKNNHIYDFYNIFVSTKNNAYMKLNQLNPSSGGKAICVSRAIDKLRQIDDFVSGGGWPMIIDYASILFLSLSAISLLALLKSVLARSLNDIRILQLLGLSSGSFLRMCVFSSILIVTFAFLFSLPLYFLGLKQLNHLILNEFGLKQVQYSFWNYQMFTHLLLPIFASSILLASVAAFLHSRKNVKNGARYIN